MLDVTEGDFLKHSSGKTAQLHSISVKVNDRCCFLQVLLLTPMGIETLRTTHEDFVKEWEKISGETHY